MTSRDLTGPLLEHAMLTLGELCRAGGVSAEYAIALIEEGLIEPMGEDPQRWRFSGTALRRVRIAVRLQRDLQLNLPGVALTLELIDELQTLRARVRRLEQLIGE